VTTDEHEWTHTDWDYLPSVPRVSGGVLPGFNAGIQHAELATLRRSMILKTRRMSSLKTAGIIHRSLRRFLVATERFMKGPPLAETRLQIELPDFAP